MPNKENEFDIEKEFETFFTQRTKEVNLKSLMRKQCALFLSNTKDKQNRLSPDDRLVKQLRAQRQSYFAVQNSPTMTLYKRDGDVLGNLEHLIVKREKKFKKGDPKIRSMSNNFNDFRRSFGIDKSSSQDNLSNLKRLHSRQEVKLFRKSRKPIFETIEYGTKRSKAGIQSINKKKYFPELDQYQEQKVEQCDKIQNLDDFVWIKRKNNFKEKGSKKSKKCPKKKEKKNITNKSFTQMLSFQRLRILKLENALANCMRKMEELQQSVEQQNNFACNLNSIGCSNNNEFKTCDNLDVNSIGCSNNNEFKTCDNLDEANCYVVGTENKDDFVEVNLP